MGVCKMNVSFEKKINDLWEDFISIEKEKHYPTIILLGSSGDGKSSLVNRIFDVDLAETSNVSPKTKGIKFYDGREFNRKINIVDTEGYELGEYNSYIANTLSALDETYEGINAQAIWYCISVANTRIEEIDIDILKEINKNKSFDNRIAIVFTKSEEDNPNSPRSEKFKIIINEDNIKCDGFFAVSNDKNFDLDIDKLVQWSSEKFNDEDFRKSFISSQMIDLDAKKSEAKKVIDNYCTKTVLKEFLSNLNEVDYNAEIAIYLMKMINELIHIYGIDSLENLGNNIVPPSFLYRIGESLFSFLFDRVDNKMIKNVINSFITGVISKTVGEGISSICYKYVESFISRLPTTYTIILIYEILPTKL